MKDFSLLLGDFSAEKYLVKDESDICNLQLEIQEGSG